MKIQKNQKPIEIDASFKYRCPTQNCGFEHWLSWQQTKVKNFKVLCDGCGMIFQPIKIKHIKISYKSQNLKNNIDTDNTMGVVLSKSFRILKSLGYNGKKAKNILKTIFTKNNNVDTDSLVKLAILELELKNE